MKGRHCVICGKPGGQALTLALKALGVPGNYAHSDCITRTRKTLAKAALAAQREVRP
jgi:hypothetical protein